MFELIGMLWKGTVGLGGRRRYRRRRSAKYYWHGYCPIHHQRQDTADKCAASAAYKKIEREALARERAELARRAERAANPIEYKDWTFLAGLAIPVLVVAAILVLCLIAR